MLIVKIKAATKTGLLSQTDSMGKRHCNNESFSLEPRNNNKDYVNEIFAGLMWLG